MYNLSNNQVITHSYSPHELNADALKPAHLKDLVWKLVEYFN